MIIYKPSSNIIHGFLILKHIENQLRYIRRYVAGTPITCETENIHLLNIGTLGLHYLYFMNSLFKLIQYFELSYAYNIH